MRAAQGGTWASLRWLLLTAAAAMAIAASVLPASAQQRTYRLTVFVEGGGRVVSSPAGIDCGRDCAQDYAGGTVVKLTAVANAGQELQSWGGSCSGTGSCSVTMNQVRRVTATFRAATPTPTATPTATASPTATAVSPTPTPSPTPAGPPPLKPPATSADDDGDGARNRSDACPLTPSGQRALRRGCSLIDLIIAPASLIGQAGDEARRAARAVRTPPRLRQLTAKPRAQLGRATRQLERASVELSEEPCDGARLAQRAARTAAAARTGFGRAIRRSQISIVKRIGRLRLRRPKTARDADTLGARFTGLALDRKRTAEAVSELRSVANLLRRPCRSVVKKNKRVSARVVSVDSAAAVAELSDGTDLALGTTKTGRAVAPGVSVQAAGTGYAGGLMTADDVVVGGLGTRPDALAGCSFSLRIAPVQDFSAPASGIFYSDARGYFGNGSYHLEGGMGINAVRSATCEFDEFADYRLVITMNYRNSLGHNTSAPIATLRGVPSEERPGRIPVEVMEGRSTGALTLEVWGYDCVGPSCDAVQLDSTETVPVQLASQGDYGDGEYDRTVFSVEDGSQTSFDTATLTGVDTTLSGATIFGVGYGVTGGASSFPSAQYILEGQQFAVHDGAGLVADYEDGEFGIPGGLLWAYVQGFRDGLPYHYVAKLPGIVTDVVDFCPSNAEDSYYRLPWKGGQIHEVTQGNNTDFTHKGSGRFAFDLVMPLATPGRAPRGGLVWDVIENRTKNSDPNAVKYWKEVSDGEIDLYEPGNELVILHQDGTWSRYVHMVPNGVVPEEDDVVERGDHVISVGNTGNSTGPHLHYEVRESSWDDTIRIRFELRPLIPGPSGPAVPCAIPGKSPWLSTND